MPKLLRTAYLRGMFVSSVNVKPLTAAEEKAWDDEQAAAKEARKAEREEKKRRV